MSLVDVARNIFGRVMYSLGPGKRVLGQARGGDSEQETRIGEQASDCVLVTRSVQATCSSRVERALVSSPSDPDGLAIAVVVVWTNVCQNKVLTVHDTES